MEKEQGNINKLPADNGSETPTSVIVPPAAATPTASDARADQTAPPPPDATVLEEQQQRMKDCYVPGANVTRIMRSVLPPTAKIADDAKEITQQCVSEFIAFITQEANEKCRRELRKTVAPEDLMWAMSQLGFGHYVPLLNRYLEKYREAESRKTFISGEVPLAQPRRRRGREEVVVIDSSPPSDLALVNEPNPEEPNPNRQDLGFIDGNGGMEQGDWLARVLERSGGFDNGRSGEGSPSSQGTSDPFDELFK